MYENYLYRKLKSDCNTVLNASTYPIIMKSLDPLRAKKTFIRKKLGHTAFSAIKSLISDPINLAKEVRGKYCIFENFNMTVVSKTNKGSKNIRIFQICLEYESKCMMIFEFSEY